MNTFISSYFLLSQSAFAQSRPLPEDLQMIWEHREDRTFLEGLLNAQITLVSGLRETDEASFTKMLALFERRIEALQGQVQALGEGHSTSWFQENDWKLDADTATYERFGYGVFVVSQGSPLPDELSRYFKLRRSLLEPLCVNAEFDLEVEAVEEEAPLGRVYLQAFEEHPSPFPGGLSVLMINPHQATLFNEDTLRSYALDSVERDQIYQLAWLEAPGGSQPILEDNKREEEVKLLEELRSAQLMVRHLLAEDAFAGHEPRHELSLETYAGQVYLVVLQLATLRSVPDPRLPIFIQQIKAHHQAVLLYYGETDYGTYIHRRVLALLDQRRETETTMEAQEEIFRQQLAQLDELDSLLTFEVQSLQTALERAPHNFQLQARTLTRIKAALRILTRLQSVLENLQEQADAEREPFLEARRNQVAGRFAIVREAEQWFFSQYPELAPQDRPPTPEQTQFLLARATQRDLDLGDLQDLYFEAMGQVGVLLRDFLDATDMADSNDARVQNLKQTVSTLSQRLLLYGEQAPDRLEDLASFLAFLEEKNLEYLVEVFRQESQTLNSSLLAQWRQLLNQHNFEFLEFHGTAHYAEQTPPPFLPSGDWEAMSVHSPVINEQSVIVGGRWENASYTVLYSSHADQPSVTIIHKASGAALLHWEGSPWPLVPGSTLYFRPIGEALALQGHQDDGTVFYLQISLEGTTAAIFLEGHASLTEAFKVLLEEGCARAGLNPEFEFEEDVSDEGPLPRGPLLQFPWLPGEAPIEFYAPVVDESPLTVPYEAGPTSDLENDHLAFPANGRYHKLFRGTQFPAERQRTEELFYYWIIHQMALIPSPIIMSMGSHYRLTGVPSGLDWEANTDYLGYTMEAFPADEWLSVHYHAPAEDEPTVVHPTQPDLSALSLESLLMLRENFISLTEQLLALGIAQTDGTQILVERDSGNFVYADYGSFRVVNMERFRQALANHFKVSPLENLEELAPDEWSEARAFLKIINDAIAAKTTGQTGNGQGDAESNGGVPPPSAGGMQAQTSQVETYQAEAFHLELALYPFITQHLDGAPTLQAWTDFIRARQTPLGDNLQETLGFLRAELPQFLATAGHPAPTAGALDQALFGALATWQNSSPQPSQDLNPPVGTPQSHGTPSFAPETPVSIPARTSVPIPH